MDEQDDGERLASPIGNTVLSRRKLLRGGLGVGAVLAGGGTVLETVTGCSSSNSTVPVVKSKATVPPALSSLGTTGNVVLQWSNMCLQAVRDTKPGPPMVARAIAIVHTCIYDAWATYDSVAVGTRLGGSLCRPAAEQTLTNKQQAISYAAYRALVDLFPTEVALFDFMMAKLGYDPADRSTDPTTPTGIGNRAARAVIEFRHHDGSNQLGDLHAGAYSDYTHYQPVNTAEVIKDPNHWQPLRVPNGLGGYAVQMYVGPHWGRVTPFALTSGSQVRPAAPPMYPSDDYVQQVKQIVQYSADLTDEQKVIAQYWADGPSSELPPGHWCLFAHFVSVRDHTMTWIAMSSCSFWWATPFSTQGLPPGMPNGPTIRCGP